MMSAQTKDTIAVCSFKICLRLSEENMLTRLRMTSYFYRLCGDSLVMHVACSQPVKRVQVVVVHTDISSVKHVSLVDTHNNSHPEDG